MYTQEEIDALIPTIFKVIAIEGREDISDAEIQRKDSAQLLEKYKDKRRQSEPVKVSKTEVLKELRDRGKDPDPKLSLEELLQMVTDLEMEKPSIN